MNCLPVVERELRVASRRSGTYRIRSLAALFTMVAFGWALLSLAQRNVPASLQGRPLFLTLSIPAFVYCLFAGAWVTSDCLSKEKREGTLGLLFLTPLKAYEVILGKLAVTSLNAFYGLLAIVPLLIMPLQLGGVTGAQIAQIVAILFNTFFFSLTVGMLISALSQDDRKAMSASVGVLFLAAVGPAIAVFFLELTFPEVFRRPESVALILGLSICYPFVANCIEIIYGAMAFGGAPVFSHIGMGCSILLYQLLGWLCLWRASVLLSQVSRYDARRGWLTRCQDKLEQWGYGNADKRLRHRSRLLDINPFLWLAARDRWKQRYVWLLLASMAATWYWSHRDHIEMMFDDDTLLPAIMILNGFLKIWVASEACARLVADRQAGALELLLSTPLSIGHILQGQWLALRRQFTTPLIATILIEYYALRHSLHLGPVLAILFLLVLDMIALGWVSLWLGLSARNTSHALGSTSLLVLILPWLILGPAIYCWGSKMANSTVTVVMFGWSIDGAFLSSFNSKVILWFTLGLLTDLILGFMWARHWLRRDFRSAAVQRY